VNAIAEALAALKVTVPAYFKEATDHTIRNRIALKLMETQGNIILNMKAPEMIWDIEVREPKVRAITGSDRHVWDETQVYEQLRIAHAELESTDVMRRRFQMINSNSPQAIVDEAGKKMDRLVRAMTRKLNSQFYIDNSGSNSQYLTGLQSFLKFSPTLVTNDWVLPPLSGTTYGGLDIGLGSLGGTWSAGLTTKPNANLAKDWPLGSGSPEYDYNAPKMLRQNGPFGGLTGWENTCLHQIRRMSQAIKHTGGEGVAPILQIFSQELYSAVEDKLETRERLRVSDYATNLGFPDTLTYGGSLLTSDYDCPAGKGFAINPSTCALYSVHSDLFFTDADWSTESQLSQFLVGFLGNYVHQPKYTGAYLYAANS
jgi:hypothetical protein